MFKTYKLIAFYVLLILTPFLQSCGGGGGGGSDGPMFTVSKSEIFFGAAVGGSQPASQTISGTVTNYSGVLYIFIIQTANGINTIMQPVIQGNAGIATVVAQNPAIGQGRYLDTITVLACSDSACNNQLSGSPRIISVSYVIGIVAEPSNLSFSVVAGMAPPSQTLTIYHYQGNQNWASSFLFHSGSGWMTYSPASGQTPTTVTVNVSAMPATASGSVFDAEIRLGANAGADSVTVPISYAVN